MHFTNIRYPEFEYFFEIIFFPFLIIRPWLVSWVRQAARSVNARDQPRKSDITFVVAITASRGRLIYVPANLRRPLIMRWEGGLRFITAAFPTVLARLSFFLSRPSHSHSLRACNCGPALLLDTIHSLSLLLNYPVSLMETPPTIFSNLYLCQSEISTTLCHTSNINYNTIQTDFIDNKFCYITN